MNLRTRDFRSLRSGPKKGAHVAVLDLAKHKLTAYMRSLGCTLRGARFRFEYSIDRDGVAIADGWTSHATVDAATLRPTRIPDWLTDALTTAESSSAPSPSRRSSS